MSLPQERWARRVQVIAPTEKRLRDRPGGMVISPTWLDPVLVQSQQNYQEVAEYRDVFQALRRGIAGVKTNNSLFEFDPLRYMRLELFDKCDSQWLGQNFEILVKFRKGNLKSAWEKCLLLHLSRPFHIRAACSFLVFRWALRAPQSRFMLLRQQSYSLVVGIFTLASFAWQEDDACDPSQPFETPMYSRSGGRKVDYHKLNDLLRNIVQLFHSDESLKLEPSSREQFRSAAACRWLPTHAVVG